MTGEITSDTKETQRIVRKQYEQLYSNKLNNLDEMDKCLETYNFPKLNQEESENLNRQITTSETEAVIKLTPQKALDQMASQMNFAKHSKNKYLSLPNYFINSRGRKSAVLHFMRQGLS